ncbi:signal recognition particle-docking protein FtsY [Corynebacterium sp. TA-R-1]|uniref:Signal recognition particle receptor FtsY n=1 Tax=Corynebacterium stercoris TaxID=2943490 RepID=A0ABT1G106_9CORY|nr:signal recognition particle-docking protein FtsY [Corynebacterium stercoris]MCP1386643.1 signal recognition particle-docking protein FtsY [Corynebacterium stercoris]
MTTNASIWIVVAIIVLALVIIGVIVAGNQRKKSKTVSFEKPVEEEPKQLTQQDKSGNYQAKGGFNFAQADAQPKQPEPVRREAPRKEAAAGGAATSGPITNDDVQQAIRQEPPKPFPEPEQETKQAAAPVEPIETAEPEVASTRVAPAVAPDDPAVEKPEASETSDISLTHDAADAVEELNADEPEVPAVEVAEPAPVAEELSPEGQQIVEEAMADELAAEAEELAVGDEVVTEERVREEAEEAANIAAVTAEVAEEARQDGAVVSDEAIVTEGTQSAAVQAEIDEIAPAAGRIGKLRGRLSRSQNAIGQGLLGILTAGDLDEDAWEEIEDTLIMADLGAELTMKVVDNLREKIAERGVSSEAEARAMLRETLVEAGRPDMDRSIKAMPNDGKPAVILVVGVNGTGKTTTTGKLARVLVSMGHTVVLGAADTFRAAAADQLETWGRRVGASTVRGKEGADPASVAFDAVATGVEQGADVVLVDTAGRLHTSTGLMDQLGKVKRVVEKKSNVDEVLLVLDATVGQNGITQARVFRDVVDITGVVLTKLDGTAKGGIVFQVQEELGVPVKLVGLGEGADDLAPFEVESFVDALLG